MDATMLKVKAWLTRHGAASDALRVEMAKWATWLGCTNPDHAKIRALNHVRLLAVDNEPDTGNSHYIYIPGRCYGLLVVDARNRNAFNENELNR